MEFSLVDNVLYAVRDASRWNAMSPQAFVISSTVSNRAWRSFVVPNQETSGCEFYICLSILKPRVG